MKPTQPSEEGLAWLENWRKRYQTQMDAMQSVPAQPILDRQVRAEAAHAPANQPEPVKENLSVQPPARRAVGEVAPQPPLPSPTIAPTVMGSTQAQELPRNHSILPARVDDPAIKPTPKTVESAAIRPAPPVRLAKPVETSAKAQPIIHVSIGRIEVRLTAAPGKAHNAATRPPAAVMSLEDYLRMRNGGGR